MSHRRPSLRWRGTLLTVLLLGVAVWACGEDTTDPNGGGTPSGNVSGTVQVQGGGGLAGVSLALSRSGQTTRNTTTASDGGFQFNNVAAGTWTLTVTPPGGYAIPGSQTHPVSVSVVADQTTQLGAFMLEAIPVGSITATVTVGGTGQAGVTVRVLNAGTSTVVASQATNANGVATFNNLALGDYDVRMVVPSGFQLPAGEVDTKAATVTEGDVTAVTFTLEPAPVTTVDVVVGASTFSPDSITISAGMTVRWTTNNALPHTVTAQDEQQSGAWSEQTFNGSGQVFQHTFTVANQKYRYRCTVHSTGFLPGQGPMNGVIVVTP